MCSYYAVCIASYREEGTNLLTAATNKKLSYRKQIARQLLTRYVEGICSNAVSLKYGLEVTQIIGHGTIRIDRSHTSFY